MRPRQPVLIPILLTLAAGCATAPPTIPPPSADDPLSPPESTAQDPTATPATPPVAPLADPVTTGLGCRRAEPLGPVLIPAARADERHGSNARTFDQLITTMEQPAEVCAIAGELELLTRLRCADGTSPFADAADAHAARVKNVGPGGRCGSVVDLYRVPCEEQTWEVFLDMYVCPEP